MPRTIQSLILLSGVHAATQIGFNNMSLLLIPLSLNQVIR